MNIIDKIICGNNIDVLKNYPDNFFDLTITSPPYDNIRSYDGYINSFDFEGIAKELFRTTKKGGVIVWVVADQTIDGDETGTSFRQALFFKEIGFKLFDTMIYKKTGFRCPKRIGYPEGFEYMFVFSKGKLKTFNQAFFIEKTQKRKKIMISRRNADGSLRKAIYIPCKNYSLSEDFRVMTNVWEFDVGFLKSTKDVFAFEHPAIFPELLVKAHILSWTNENDIVLDPFCGSGTTCKVAKMFNRHFIGIDINPKYCKISEKRIANLDNNSAEAEEENYKDNLFDGIIELF